MKCSNCQNELPATARICPTCGTPVVQNNQPYPDYPYPQNAPTQRSGHNPQQPHTQHPHQGHTGFTGYLNPYAQNSSPYNAAPSQPNIPPTQYAPPPPTPPINVPPPTTGTAFPPTNQAQYHPFPSTPSYPSLPQTTPPEQPQPKKTGLIAVIALVLVSLVAGLGFWGYNTYLHSGQTNNPTATSTTTQTATSSATPNGTLPYPPSNVKATSILNDTMQAANANKWDEQVMHNSKGDSTCGYRASDSAYHVASALQNELLMCNAEASSLTNLQNVTVEATVTIVAGQKAGIALRYDGNQHKCYLFRITTNGDYSLGILDFNQTVDKGYNELKSGSVSVINKSLGAKNTIAFTIQSSTLTAYVNGVEVDTATDSANTLPNGGLIGIVGESGSSPSLDLKVPGVRAWQL